MLNFQGTVYIRNGITYSMPLIGGSIFLVNPGSVLIINQHLLHHCHLISITGDSYRVKGSKQSVKKKEVQQSEYR